MFDQIVECIPQLFSKLSLFVGFYETEKKVCDLVSVRRLNKKNGMRLIIFLLACFLAFGLGSCSVVNGIFKAGMAWGILLVVGFIALIIFIIAKVSGGRK